MTRRDESQDRATVRQIVQDPVEDIDRALHWWQVMRDAGKEPAQDAGVALIQALGRRGNLAAAESVLSDLSFYMPWQSNAPLVHAALRGCAEAADVQGLTRWLQLMSEHGRDPDGFSYLAILEGFAKVHRSDLAQSWWDSMIGRGIEPQGGHYDAMMNAQKPDGFRPAQSWFLRMADAGVVPQVRSYSAVIERAPSESVALSWFNKMVRHGYVPDMEACKSMLLAISRCATESRAVEWLRTMELDFNCQPDLACYNIVLNAGARAQGSRFEPEVLLREMSQRRIRPDAFTFNTLLSSAARTGNDEGVKKWLLRMGEEGISPNLVAFNAIIDSFARRGLMSDAERWLKELKDAGLQPNVRSYTPFSAALAQRGDVVATARWLRTMIEDSVSPNAVSHATLVDAHVSQGNATEASATLDRLLEAGADADARTISAVLRCCTRAGEHEKALRWFEFLRASGGHISGADLSAAVQSAAARGEPQEAASWMQEAQAKGLSVKVRAFAAVAKAYAAKGRLILAARTLTQMRQAGHRVTASTWATLLAALAAGPKRPGEAELLLRQMAGIDVAIPGRFAFDCLRRALGARRLRLLRQALFVGVGPSPAVEEDMGDACWDSLQKLWQGHLDGG
ncbi:EMB2745 [Symbiodinium sp. CCMP2592]|nr:EMB2745 [Symbiodinium sp. CCMP2592]